MTVFYRVLPRKRRRFAPYDGEPYQFVGEGKIPEYMLLEVNGRKQRVPRDHFERLEEPNKD